VFQQPDCRVFCFEGQKVPYPASSFLPDIKQNWRNLTTVRCQHRREGSDETIVGSSDSFVVFVFSFDVLTQDCKLKIGPLVMYISKSRQVLLHWG